ncbi:MAG: DUF945 family protein [Cardiobacteriaceae bacterium]|nr:DUF945 family protein [Cardiobacteriaceae bacterium]
MKKTLLASALFAGISAYAAIPTDINERADLVQKRVEATTANVGKAYQTYLQASPIINKIDVAIRDYTRTDSGASDKTVLTIDWNNGYFNGEAPPVKELVFNSTIDYSDAVAKEGKLAVIKSDIDADALAQSFGIAKDSKEFATLNEILKHVELSATFGDGDALEQHIRIKPVDAKPKDGVHITYEGFDYTVQTTDADLVHGYGKTTVKSGKFEAVNSHEINDGPKKIVVQPFAGEGEFKKNGDMTFNLAPFEVHIDDTIIKAKELDAKGKDMAFDASIGGWLGKFDYRLNDIAVATATAPETVYVKTVAVKGEVQKSNDLYHTDVDFEILPVSEAFRDISGGMSDALGIQSLTGKMQLKNLSETFYHEFNSVNEAFQSYAGNLNDEGRRTEAEKMLASHVDALLAEAGKHNASNKFELSLNTDNGNAEIKSWFEMLKGSKPTYAAIKSAFEADSPDALIKLLNDNVRFEVNVTLPKALADATGMTPMIEAMAGQLLKLDGNHYKLVIKNDGKAITLNGEAFPPAM